jgi:hypothetical protein
MHNTKSGCPVNENLLFVTKEILTLTEGPSDLDVSNDLQAVIHSLENSSESHMVETARSQSLLLLASNSCSVAFFHSLKSALSR